MTQSIAHVNPDELPRLQWEDGWLSTWPHITYSAPPARSTRCQACALTDNHHIRRCLLPTDHAGPHLGQP